MPVTIDEIDRFTRFAKQAAGQTERADSLEECLRLWREEQETEEVVEQVRRAEGIAAGRYATIEEADRQIRVELGWAARDE